MAQVTKVALAVPVAQSTDLLLIIPGEKGMGHVLVGEAAGTSWPLAEFEELGLLVDDIAFDVDFSSAYTPDAVRKIEGTLFRQNDGLGLFSRRKAPGFMQIVHGALQDELSPSESNMRVGFLRWRVTHGSDEKKVTLYEHSASLVDQSSTNTACDRHPQ